MKHSYVKIWVHAIWATFDTKRIINKNLVVKIFNHLVAESEKKGIHTERINVQPEHVHYLFELPVDKSLASVIHDIKGECSSWINKNKLTKSHFKWQRGYGAYSVSASVLNKVKLNIENQAEYHKRVPFEKEHEQWKRKYGIKD
ncbi:transposase [bacterium]|nr:transposase [bacterium]